MNLFGLIGILVGSYALLTIASRAPGLNRLDPRLRGRLSLAFLFLFTGLGHFVKEEGS